MSVFHIVSTLHCLQWTPPAYSPSAVCNIIIQNRRGVLAGGTRYASCQDIISCSIHQVNRGTKYSLLGVQPSTWTFSHQA